MTLMAPPTAGFFTVKSTLLMHASANGALHLGGGPPVDSQSDVAIVALTIIIIGLAMCTIASGRSDA